MKMKWFARGKIGRQLHSVYIVALLIPLTVIGLLLIFSARRTLHNYYVQVLETDNARVKALLRQITTKTYGVSNRLCFDGELQRLLSEEYDSSADFYRAVDQFNQSQVGYDSDEISKICIYTDNPTAKNYRQFYCITEQLERMQWYARALGTSSAFWTSIPETSSSNTSNNLSLVRRMNLPSSDYSVVVVVQVSDSHIRTCMESSSIVDMVSLDDQGIVYGSSTSRYGDALPVEVDYTQPYFRDSGQAEVEGKPYYYAISTINLYMTNSRMYVCNMDSSGVTDIQQLTMTWLLVLAVALAVPLLTVSLYASYFSGRINLLREEMHKASRQDYDILPSFSGNDELAEAFEDLKIMVRDIKEKDARMYEAELNEQALRNRQQLMEYKMLSSQINPHYLYNTLETIRMKALTTGSREVADAIKLLGKTLHYVQENTGVTFTTLQKELEHVRSYLAIQKLRFGERINYELAVETGIEPEKISILPLTLQPVVENAVVHGLETVDGIGLVRIHILREGKQLHIHIRDNGRGMTEQQLQSIMDGINAPQLPHSSIALYNIHQRIRLRYGEAYGVKVESTLGQGTEVCLCIPAE